MANYYQERKAAIQDIDDMVEKNLPEDFIIFRVSMKYGFTKKIVLERLKQLELMKKLVQDQTKNNGN